MVTLVEPSAAPAGWQPDPTGRYEFRYHNGDRWTSDVSMHGQRFVDPAGQHGPAPAWGPQTPGWGPQLPGGGAQLPGWGPQLLGDRVPSRGFALAAFWVALGSLMLAWIPFVFVLGGAGAITAIVFAVLALGRVRSGHGTGRGYAIMGIVLSVAALGACVAGLSFTRTVMREFDEFIDVGEHSEQIDSCVTTDGLVRVDGSITNEDAATHDYTVTVGYRAGGDLVETDVVTVASVAPGATAAFHASAFVDDEPPITCTIESVTGPNPFDPNT
jgi:hypothetical protein